jgi:hypothetical protein
MLLLSAIGGYWVLERSEVHKGELRRIGRLLGGTIIILSLGGLILRGWTACQWMKGGAGMGWSCPFSHKSVPALKP